MEAHSTQVSKEHYDFSTYVDHKRWMSYWYQCDQVLSLSSKSVLEIGIGNGIFKSVISNFGLEIKTLDIDPNLKPDYLGSATKIPMTDNSFDVVCAFQVLEHLPYEQSLLAFAEMVRVSSKYIFISVPDAEVVWRFQIHLPKIGEKKILIRKPMQNALKGINKQHSWELNFKGQTVSSFVNDILQSTSLTLLSSVRLYENPYHRFFLFKKGT